MRVLVTGGSGYVGSHLVRRLLAAGLQVRGTYRRLPPAIPGASWSAVQLEEPVQWPALLAGTDAVVHLAALVHQPWAGANRWGEFERVNVEGTRMLARACAAAAVSRLLLISSIAVHSRAATRIDEHVPLAPQDDYGRSKVAAEEALRAELGSQATDWCVLRPPLVYGSGAPGNVARLQALVARGFPLPFGCIRNSRSFMFIDNLTDAILTVLQHPVPIRESYVLSDGSDFSTRQLVNVLAAAAGRRARLLAVPVSLLRIMGRCGDFAARTLGIRVLDSRMVDSLVGSLLVDSSKFRESFGWQPPVTAARALELAFGPGAVPFAERT